VSNIAMRKKGGVRLGKKRKGKFAWVGGIAARPDQRTQEIWGPEGLL